MLRLFLLRHGKAADRDKYENDFDRPLRKKGVAQLNQVGYHLKREKKKIGQIISSSAQRTKETTQITNHFLNINNVLYDKSLYLTSYENIRNFLGEHANSDAVLYVGHNFGISDAAASFSGERISLSTGMLVELTFDFDDWKMVSANTGTIVSTFKPDIYIP